MRDSAGVPAGLTGQLIRFAEIGLGLTSGSLAALAALHSARPAWVELAVLIAANLIATGVRFLLMRIWVFRAAA